MKLDGVTGEVLWSQHYASEGAENESVYGMALDASDDVIVTGRMYETGREDELVTIKFAGVDGAFQWESKEGGAARLDDRALSVDCGGTSDPVVAGLVQNADGSASLMVVRYAGASGGILWTDLQPGIVNDLSGDGWVAVDAAGDAVACWKMWGGATSYDIRVVKYDGADGSVLWQRTYNHAGASADDPSHMILDAAGDVLIAGVTAGNYLTVKLSGTDGATLWSATYEGPQGWYDVANHVLAAPDGTVMVTGFSDGVGSGWDVATLAYDGATGKHMWTARWDGESGSTDEGRCLSLDPTGTRLYVSGYTYAAGTGMDELVLAYSLPVTSDAAAAPLPPAFLDAYPNPFNPRVTVDVRLDAPDSATLTVRDLRGREVAVLHAGDLPAGRSAFVWNGRDDAGRDQPAGVYVAELRTGRGVSARKLSLVR
ncbi:T9SS type A sorting domain-containing protein [bacterium]|nr:T9SS type A sorting domain-containing protein [bacterium]